MTILPSGLPTSAPLLVPLPSLGSLPHYRHLFSQTLPGQWQTMLLEMRDDVAVKVCSRSCKKKTRQGDLVLKISSGIQAFKSTANFDALFASACS